MHGFTKYMRAVLNCLSELVLFRFCRLPVGRSNRSADEAAPYCGSDRSLGQMIRFLLAGIALRWHWLMLDLRDSFRVKSKPRRNAFHGFKIGAAVVGSHLSIDQLEPRVLLAADLNVLQYSVYDFGDVQVHDLGVHDNTPVLVGDMWNSIDDRMEGRVLMGDGNGGFSMMEVGSLGDGDTTPSTISANGLFIGGYSQSPTSVDIGQGFIASIDDPMSLTAIDYPDPQPNSFLTNPVSAVTDSAVSFGAAEGLRVPFAADTNGSSYVLPGEQGNVGIFDTDQAGSVVVGVVTFPNSRFASLWPNQGEFGVLPNEDSETRAYGVSEDGRYIIGDSIIFDFNTFQTITRVALWRDIDGVIEAPGSQTADDYELVILQTPQGDFQGEGLSVTTLEDGSWLAGGISENGAWIYQEGMDGPVYLADVLADEGAELDWNPQAVERLRFDSETGWLHMAVSGSSYYVGLQIAEPSGDDGPTHEGTEGNDNLRVNITGLSRVVIDAKGGNDRITVFGTPEPDLVVEVYAGTGNDRVRFNTDVAGLVYLGPGNDDFSVRSRFSSDLIVNAESGRNSIRTGSGDDMITTGDGGDTIRSGAGDDVIDAGSGRNRIWAGAGNDLVLGGDDSDLVWSGAGDDVVDAGGGNDYAWGGSGNDLLLGRAGNDRFFGGSGNDSIFGGLGSDLLFGQSGDDILSGGDGRDILYAGAGLDLLYTGADRDIAFAGLGDRIVRDDRDRFWWSSALATKIDEEEFIAGLDGVFGRLEDLGLAYPLL